MKKVWLQIQDLIAENISISYQKVWITSLTAQISANCLVLTAPSAFIAEFVTSRFFSIIHKAAQQVMGTACSVTITHTQCAKSSSFSTVQDASGNNDTFFPTDKTETMHSRPPLSPNHASIPEASVPAVPVSGTATQQGVPEQPTVTALPSPRPLSAVQVGLLPMPLLHERSPAKPRIEKSWRHSFNDFVVGPSNELAFAASRSMCNNFAASDVLFLSSAPGLGKTHLIQAVGKALCEKCNVQHPSVEYLTSEEFVSSFYLALKTSETDRFKARFRTLDLLLLEDVHFFQGKEKMQLELLSTIKALSTKGAKVIFTSSFMARDLTNLDDQLQSRMCAGLLSNIEKPDEETRKRIFRQKASLYQVILPTEVEEVLAHHIHADVRQIESCLQNLILKAQLFNCGITMQMAWETISNYAAHSPLLDFEGIIDYVCKGFGLNREQLFSPRRKQNYVSARNTAYFLARKHTDLSLEAIGRRFNRKHSTVIKGITSLEREMSRQTPLGSQISNTLTMIERNGNRIPSFQPSV